MHVCNATREMQKDGKIFRPQVASFSPLTRDNRQRLYKHSTAYSSPTSVRADSPEPGPTNMLPIHFIKLRNECAVVRYTDFQTIRYIQPNVNYGQVMMELGGEKKAETHKTGTKEADIDLQKHNLTRFCLMSTTCERHEREKTSKVWDGSAERDRKGCETKRKSRPMSDAIDPKS